MPQDLIIWDNRLAGQGRPGAKEVLEVGESTSLDLPISWVVGKSGTYGKVNVIIMCHGIGPPPQEGGYGLSLCSGFGVSLEGTRTDGTTVPNTVDRFLPWRGHVDLIELRCCAAAYINPGRDGKIGDGNLMCMRLAQTTQAYVRASTAPQNYDNVPGTGFLYFLPWVGTVLLYTPTGAASVDNAQRGYYGDPELR